MLRYSAMTNYQAFRWLWRFDPEAKWFWLRIYLFTRAKLSICVKENLYTFGSAWSNKPFPK